MSIVRRLVCDWPKCGRMKDDLVWWEDDIGRDDGPWNHTKDGRHWCPSHNRTQINELLEKEKV